MEITGKITNVLAAQSGVSQRTGSAWKSQEFVIEIPNGQYQPKHACFRIFGEQRIGNIAPLLVVGNNVKVSFDIDSREVSGRWFVSLDAWKVEAVTVDPATGFPVANNANGAAVPQNATPAPAAVPPPAAAAIPAPQVSAGGDQLPF